MRYTAYLPGLLLALALFAVAGAAQAAAPLSEISIKPDGTFSATNVVVMQKAGSNLFSRITWGNVFLRITVLASAAALNKNNGGVASVDDIQEGDVLAVKGTLSPGADTLLINATTIRDLSLNKEPKTLSGVVKSVDYSGSFVLPNKGLGAVTVLVDSNTTITKGVRTIALGELSAGDKILSVSGIYDYGTQTLTATSTAVYQDNGVFNPRNFAGTLKSISGTDLPATLVVTIGKADYTVYLPATATVMSKNKAATTLQRFTVGDSVRFYGAIRPTNLFEIDAELIRNTSF